MTDANIHALNFEEFLNGLVRERGLTLKKISEVTGISVKHLSALASGEFKTLPSAPYFRGYLLKLGRVLEFDPAPWWIKFKEGGFVKDAGTHDAPPANRFIRPTYVKFMWIGALAFAGLTYGIVRLPAIMGKPEITVVFPAENPARATANVIELLGTLENGSDLYVNGEIAVVNSNHTWSQQALLQSGMNTFNIRAQKFLGGETTLVWEIFYDPPADVGSRDETQPVAASELRNDPTAR